MRSLGLAALALAVLALVAPGASAATGELAFQPGYLAADLRLEGILDGPAARDVRAAIDDPSAGGNGDGMVTRGEATHFTVLHRSTFEAQVESAVAGGNMTLDGAVPEAEFLEVTLDGAEGPITSLEPIATGIQARLSFQPAPGPMHTLRMTAQEPAAGSLLLTVRAPTGHEVRAVTGLPEAAQAEDRASVTFDTAVAGPERTITFGPATPRPTPTGTAPAPAPGLLAAGLAAGAALLARRANQK